MLIALDAQTFNERVLVATQPKVVIFKASWSGAWQLLLHTIQELSEQYEPHISFYTVDIEERPKLMKRYNIHQIPTFMLFERGELIDYHAGILSSDEIREKLLQFGNVEQMR